MTANARRIPSSVVRQRFSATLDEVQEGEVHIVRGSSVKGKSVAVLVSQDRFNALTTKASVGEALLRELDEATANELRSRRNDPALKAMQGRIRSALASLQPKPQYSLSEMLARVPKDGLAVDREFDVAKPVGGELL